MAHPSKTIGRTGVSSHANPDVGVAMDAAGDVRSGFEFQIRRNPDLADSSNQPWKRVPLQWMDEKHFDKARMFNGGEFKVDTVPVCGFEASAHKVKVPEKSLNSVEEMVDTSNVGKKISQRNCQTWIVESADQLVKDDIFNKEAAASSRSPAVICFHRPPHTMGRYGLAEWTYSLVSPCAQTSFLIAVTIASLIWSSPLSAPSDRTQGCWSGREAATVDAFVLRGCAM